MTRTGGYLIGVSTCILLCALSEGDAFERIGTLTLFAKNKWLASLFFAVFREWACPNAQPR